MLLILISLLLISIGCQHVPDVEPGTNGGNGGTPVTPTVPDDTTICFSRDILPVFIAGCARPGCHDAVSRQDGYELTDWQHIVSKGVVPYNADASELYEVITETRDDKRMPQAPNPRLSSEQIALIRRWINEGAKDGTDCPPKSCDENVFTYSGAIVPIVNGYCKGCHNSASPAGGFSLDTYSGVKAMADNGKLLGAVKRLAGYSPMPKGGSSLSSCQIAQIEKWISAGAQNN